MNNRVPFIIDTDLLLRLYIICEDMSYAMYDTFIETLALKQEHFSHITLLESRIFSLFYVSRLIIQNNLSEEFRGSFIESGKGNIYREFSAYMGSQKGIAARFDLYESSVQVLRYKKDWIENSLNHFQDQLLKSENIKYFFDEYSSEKELFNYKSSEIKEFVLNQKLNIKLFKNALNEVISFHQSQVEGKDLSQSKVTIIRNAFETNELYQGGFILFKELSQYYGSPDDSNTILLELKKIETQIKLRNVEIEKSKKYLKNNITKIFKTNPWSFKSFTKSMYETRIFLGNFKNAAGKTVELIFTKGELIQKWLELQTDSLSETFKKTMFYTDEMISAITSGLNIEDIKFGTFLLSDFYPKYIRGSFIKYGIDETYGNLFGTRITHLMTNLWGKYTYCIFEDDLDILQYQNLISNSLKSDFHKQENDSRNNPIEDEDVDWDEEEELGLLNEISTDDITRDLHIYENAFNHLMASLNSTSDQECFHYPMPIKTENVFNIIMMFIYQIESFKLLTEPIFDLAGIFRDTKILQAITENFGIEYRNLTYEFLYRLDCLANDFKNQPATYWRKEIEKSNFSFFLEKINLTRKSKYMTKMVNI